MMKILKKAKHSRPSIKQHEDLLSDRRYGPRTVKKKKQILNEKEYQREIDEFILNSNRKV